MFPPRFEFNYFLAFELLNIFFGIPGHVNDLQPREGLYFFFSNN